MRSHATRARLCRLVLFLGLGLSVLAPTAAFAQTEEPVYPTTPTTPTTDVAGTTVTAPHDPTASRSSLPFTGGDIALLTVLGVVAVASGAAVVVFTRRRSTTPA